MFDMPSGEKEEKKEAPTSPYTKYLEIRLNMMQKILERLETTDDFDEIINSVTILKDFCNRFNIISDQKEVFEKFFLNEANLNAMINILLTTTNKIKLVQVATLIKHIFQMLNNTEDKISISDDLNNWLQEHRLNLENALYISIINNMDEIHKVFKNPVVKNPTIINTYGESQQRLGVEKIT